MSIEIKKTESKINSNLRTSRNRSVTISSNNLYVAEDILQKDKKVINYVKELTYHFYNQMLPFIIDEWEVHVKDRSMYNLSDDDINYNSRSDIGKSRRSTSSRVDFDKSNASINKVASINKDASINRVASINKVASLVRSNSSFRSSGSIRKIMSAPLPVIQESMMVNLSRPSGLEDDISLDEPKTYSWMEDNEKARVTIKFKNGNEYVGDVSNKKFHGHGKYKWNDGSQYEGYFKNGHISGYGHLTYTDLSYYKGNFCKGLLDGHGAIYPVSTKMVYSGEFKEGKKNGKGWMFYDENSYYDGEWLDNLKHGYGYEVFKNGTQYKGYWVRGKMEGKGSIHYYNSDFYKGEFVEGLLNGYGEYTWNAIRTVALACGLDNTYQGSWSEGKRNGLGVMYFGLQGSKLVGEWIENLKHGIGIMSCGDGTVIKKNPLFENDGPCHIPVSTNMDSPTNERKLSAKRRQSVDKSKEKPKYIGFIGAKLANSDEEMSNNDKFPFVQPICNPIHIPIHGIWFNIDLTYHINNIFDRVASNESEIVSSKPRLESKWNLLTSTNNIVSPTEFVEKGMNYELEERKLRNCILFNHDLLENLYNKYATLTLSDNIDTFKPVLTRLFMWQMYRDFEMYKQGFSLVDIDLIMMESNLLDVLSTSQHYPFEKIYMWQFLHLLLQVSIYCYPVHKYYRKYKESGTYAKIFEDFIRDYVNPKQGRFEGEFLFKYKDLLPIKSTYLLYRTLGEPHSARTFLKACCCKRKCSPPQYLKDFDGEDNIVRLDIGKNVLCANNFLYVPDDPPDIGERPKDNPKYPMDKDPFYKTFKLFRKLGIKKITKFLIKVCPLISTDGYITNINYQLTFLEFYEIVLMCGNAIIDGLKQAELKRLYAEYLETLPKVDEVLIKEPKKKITTGKPKK